MLVISFAYLVSGLVELLRPLAIFQSKLLHALWLTPAIMGGAYLYASLSHAPHFSQVSTESFLCEKPGYALVAAQPEVQMHMSFVVIVIETRVQERPQSGRVKPAKSHHGAPNKLHKKVARMKLTGLSARIATHDSRRKKASVRTRP